MNDDEPSAADDMLEGRCCSECGAFFENDHGYPVLCVACWENYVSHGGKAKHGITPDGLQQAIFKEFGE